MIRLYPSRIRFRYFFATTIPINPIGNSSSDDGSGTATLNIYMTCAYRYGFVLRSSGENVISIAPRPQMSSGSTLCFKNRQDISRGILEPRDLRAGSAGDPFFICFDFSFVVVLKVNAAPAEIAHRAFNVVDRDI